MNNKKVSQTHCSHCLFWSRLGLLEATMGTSFTGYPACVGSGDVSNWVSLMYWAYQNTGRRSAILYVGLLAASIKAINFAFPIHWEGWMRVYTR
jgi:hypothetical protein